MAYVAAAVNDYVVVVMMSDPVHGAADYTSINDIANSAMARAASENASPEVRR